MKTKFFKQNNNVVRALVTILVVALLFAMAVIPSAAANPGIEQPPKTSSPVLTGLVISPCGAGLVLVNFSSQEAEAYFSVSGTSNGELVYPIYTLQLSAQPWTMVGMFAPWNKFFSGIVFLNTRGEVYIPLGETRELVQGWEGSLTAYAPPTNVITSVVRTKVERWWNLDHKLAEKSLRTDKVETYLAEDVTIALVDEPNDLWPVEVGFPTIAQFVWATSPHSGVTIAMIPAGETVWVNSNSLGTTSFPMVQPLTNERPWAGQTWLEAAARFIISWDEHGEGGPGELTWLLGVQFPKEITPPIPTIVNPTR